MMQKQLSLQDLSEGLREAVIREWYVQEKQIVKKGEPLLAFETAKAIMEAPMPCDGEILQLHVKPGDKIQADQFILTLHIQSS